MKNVGFVIGVSYFKPVIEYIYKNVYFILSILYVKRSQSEKQLQIFSILIENIKEDVIGRCYIIKTQFYSLV